MSQTTLTSPINNSSSSYGSETLTHDRSEFKKNQVPSFACSDRVRYTLMTLGLLGFGVSTGFAVAEQLKDDHHRSIPIYNLCTFSAGLGSALFYQSICPDRMRKKINFWMSATLVSLIFFLKLVEFSDRLSHRDKEIMLGAVFSFLFGFHALRNILIKVFLSPAESDASGGRTEDPNQLFPMILPNTRDLEGTTIMLCWHAFSCGLLGGLYVAFENRLTGDLADIGVYQNGLAALVGGLAGLLGVLLGVQGMEKFENYYKTVQKPSPLLQKTLQACRSAGTAFSLLSSTIQAALLQVLTSLYSTLPTKRQIRQAANSSLSFAIMMVAGAVFTAQYFLERKKKEEPLSMCNKIMAKEQKKICSGFTCRADWKTCKKVIKTIFPYICILTMMGVFAAILGMTKSDVIKGAAWGIEATFVVMGLLTLYFGNQSFEPLEEGASYLSEWKTKFANGTRFLIQTPDVIVPLFMYFTTKFPLDNIHLKKAKDSPALLAAIISGLTLYAAAFVQNQMLYRREDLAPHEVPYLALMQLSNLFFKAVLPAQGNHT